MSKQGEILKWTKNSVAHCAQFFIRAYFCKNLGGIRADF